MLDIIKKITKKQIRLGLLWHNSFISFCTLGFTADNSFIFSSNFHIREGLLEIGTTKVYKNQQMKHLGSNSCEIKNGCHISLHPRGQVMHIRENQNGPVLSEKTFNWFPVKKTFHLLSLHSPPLDECEKSKKTTPFLAPAPQDYKDSILLQVDIFPKETKQHFAHPKTIWFFWGYCPEYLVRVSFILSGQRCSAILFWPVDEGIING